VSQHGRVGVLLGGFPLFEEGFELGFVEGRHCSEACALEVKVKVLVVLRLRGLSLGLFQTFDTLSRLGLCGALGRQTRLIESWSSLGALAQD